MASEKPEAAVPDTTVSETATSDTTLDKLVKWLESGRYKNFILWLAVLWLTIRGIDSKSGRETQERIWRWIEPAAVEIKGDIKKFWEWLTTNKLVVWTFRLYFGALALLTLAVVILLIVQSKTGAMLAIVMAATLVAIPTMLVYRAEKNSDQKNQSIPARLFASFNRFVKGISIAVFLSLTAAIFLIYMPAGLAPLSIKVMAYAIFVMMAFLAIALDAKWQGGLVIFLIACVLLMTGLGVFGESKLVGWANELRVNQPLVTIQSTAEIECFDATGRPHIINNTQLTIPNSSVVTAVFDQTITTIGNCTAVLVYTENKISGPATYALLRKGENYRRL